MTWATIFGTRRAIALATVTVLWWCSAPSAVAQISTGYMIATNLNAITIFADDATTEVTRKFTVTNYDSIPLQIGLFQNYSLEGSHVFNFRHHIYPRYVTDDPAENNGMPTKSENWEWSWADTTGFGGKNVPHWWIVQNMPGRARRRLGSVDFPSLFSEIVEDSAMNNPRPKELSALTVLASREYLDAKGFPCRANTGSDKAPWNKFIHCEAADKVADELGCRPVLTQVIKHEYYMVRVPQDCTARQLRSWMEGLDQDIPLLEVYPNSHTEPNEEGRVEGGGVTSDVYNVAAGASLRGDPFDLTGNWNKTQCYQRGIADNRNMLDWAVQFDANSLYFEKEAHKKFSHVPVAYVISAYAPLYALDSSFQNIAQIENEGTSSSEDKDDDGVKGNKLGMWVENNQLVGAGTYSRSGDARTLGFYSATFSRPESLKTIGSAPLMKFYSCAGGSPDDLGLSEAGVILCLQWLQENHRRLNITMIIHAYEIQINWSQRSYFSSFSRMFPQLTVSHNSKDYDDPPSGQRQKTPMTVHQPASFAIDAHNWGAMVACSEVRTNGSGGGWAGAYSTGALSCVYQSYAAGCIQNGAQTVDLGTKKTIALAWLVGRFALLQHYNRLANTYDYRIFSSQRGANSGYTPATYFAPGVNQIIDRFDPDNDHIQGLVKEFVLQPGETKTMDLIFTRDNRASGVADTSSPFFRNRVGNIEVFASDVVEGWGPNYIRAMRIPYRLDWGADDGSMPRWYLGED